MTTDRAYRTLTRGIGIGMVWIRHGTVHVWYKYGMVWYKYGMGDDMGDGMGDGMVWILGVLGVNGWK